jgi:mono/diheme cytochrome c family protein
MTRTFAAVVALTLAAPALAASPAATYNQSCRACHGPRGQGSPLARVPIAGTPVDRVKKAVAQGKGKMKAMKLKNADDVASYVAAMRE